MKIVILGVDHLYSNLVIKGLIKAFKKDIKLVVVSGVILHNRSFLSSLKKYFQVSGFYYLFAQAIKLEIYKVLSKISKNETSKFYSFRNLLRKYKISLRHEENVNDEQFLKLLKKIEPDLIVSVFFNQLLSKELINLPKKGVINIHPAYLPNYKGVSPVFWALVNKEKFGGVSIHFINEGIDTGRIIDRKRIVIKKADGEDSLYMRSATEGVNLLVKAINGIKNTPVREIKDKPFFLNKINNNWGSYYSLPTREAVKKFKKNGRKFFDIREYIFN